MTATAPMHPTTVDRLIDQLTPADLHLLTLLSATEAQTSYDLALRLTSHQVAGRLSRMVRLALVARGPLVDEARTWLITYRGQVILDEVNPSPAGA